MSALFNSDGSFPLQFVIIFIVIFAVLAAGVLAFRRLSGRGMALSSKSGPRGRQPRLGIVDIYELDRQRQLILLRRDNVEHLLLVGGPNDVIVERNINRGAGARMPLDEVSRGESLHDAPAFEPDRPADPPVAEVPPVRPPAFAIDEAQPREAPRSSVVDPGRVADAPSRREIEAEPKPAVKPSRAEIIAARAARRPPPPLAEPKPDAPARPAAGRPTGAVEPTFEGDVLLAEPPPTAQRPAPDRFEPKTERPAPDRFEPKTERPDPDRSEPKTERPDPDRFEPKTERVAPDQPGPEAAARAQRTAEPVVSKEQAAPVPPITRPTTSRPVDAAVLSDMARQLEEALRRPSGAVSPAPILAGRAEVATPPAAPAPSGLERRQRVEPKPVEAPVKPTTPQADPGRSAPRHVDVIAAAMATAEEEPAKPPSREAVEAATPVESKPFLPAPPPPAPEPEPTPPPRPKAAEASQNPFSVEEIEAEFARLLGRPLDKKG